MNNTSKTLLVLAFPTLLLGSGCKDHLQRIGQKLNPFAKSTTTIGSTETNPDGANAGDQTGASAPKADLAADALHASVLAALKSKHPTAENKTWFESKALIDGDWIANSPKNYIGIDAANLPKGYDCPKAQSGCDAVFERKICSTDADCSGSHTKCSVLRASVAAPGGQPKTMCLGSGDAMLNDYYDALTLADKHLEIASLTFPSGRFRKSLVNALAYLTHKPAVPTVRMLVSSMDGATPNLLNPPAKMLNNLLDEVKAAGGDTSKLKMNFAYLSDKLASWNHSKIILADGISVLQGGHNMLDPDYVQEAPIFDISIHAHGDLGQGVQNFVNTLWASAGPMASNFGKDEKIIPPTITPSGTGNSHILGMGRMGSFGDNAADDGIIALVSSAKKSIYLAQQDIYNDIAKLGAKPSYALPALVDAVLRGVTVKVMQSSSTKFLGYGMVAPEKAYGLLKDAITKEAETRKFSPPNNLTLTEYICQQVEYAPTYFSSKITKWPDGTDIGVHHKIIIVDETGFYNGSQNFYPSDLQEFGLLVSDSALTAQLITAFWTPLWEQSKTGRIPCR